MTEQLYPAMDPSLTWGLIFLAGWFGAVTAVALAALASAVFVISCQSEKMDHLQHRMKEIRQEKEALFLQLIGAEEKLASLTEVLQR